MSVINKKTIWIELCILSIVMVFVFTPILHFEIFSSKVGDYIEHIKISRQIFNNPQNVPSSYFMHAGWQWLVALTHAILRRSWIESAFLITLGSNMVTAAIIFLQLRKKINPLIAGSLTLGLLIVGPIIFLIPVDQKFVGYLWPNVYHNPTFLLLKPLAVLQFFFVIDTIGKSNCRWKEVIIPVVVSALTVYVKPNFIICLLPAIAILALIYSIKRHPVDWKKLLFGIALPSTIILVWQYFGMYGTDVDDSTIAVMPFIVMSFHSNFLIPKFLFSIIFPIVVTINYWKVAIRDIRIQLGWVGFLIGAIFTYFFAETGLRLYHGNFIWSGEITVFILFVSCVLLLAEHKFQQKHSIGKWLILATGFLHLYSGVYYYFSQMIILNN